MDAPIYRVLGALQNDDDDDGE